MKFNRDDYASFNHYFSQFEDELLKKIRFRSPLTEGQQVLEVGSGTGHFASLFLTHHCEPCKRIVATDFDPVMMDFARKHFSHEQIVYDTLDITSHSVSDFLGKYGKFDRIFSFLLFHLVEDQKTAYANVAKLLNDHGECLVLAFSSFDFADVWEEVCKTPKWTNRLPNPRTIVNSFFNFHRVKSTAQVEADVRDALLGTGLQCISCEVHHHSWKHENMESLLDMLLTVVPFKAIVPAEEWTDFVDLWTQLLHRKLCPEPGQPLALKFAVYVVHGCRATAQ